MPIKRRPAAVDRHAIATIPPGAAPDLQLSALEQAALQAPWVANIAHALVRPFCSWLALARAPNSGAVPSEVATNAEVT